MVYWFNKKIKIDPFDEYSIEISIKHGKDNEAQFNCYKNHKLWQTSKGQYSDKLNEIDKRMINYNIGFSCTKNDRTFFDQNFDKEFYGLSRVIGITNGLGNYFTPFVEEKYACEIKYSFFKDIQGFAFLDWANISFDGNENNQIIYIISETDSEKFKDEIDKLYDIGLIGRIHYEDQFAHDKDLYWVCPEELSSRKTLLVSEIIRKINLQLNNKFGRQNEQK